MKTASWQTYTGPGRISISRAVPRGTPAGYRIFKLLAPGPWFNSVSAAEYERLYAAQVLASLDPRETWERLHQLVLPAEPVLMCWERPPFSKSNWCHRRTCVAVWFEAALSVEVPELETGTPRLL